MGEDVIEVAPGDGPSDRAALQAAVDALSVDRLAAGRDPGGTVALTTGAFHLDRPLVVRSHVAVVGASLVHTRLIGPGDRVVVRFEDGAEGAALEQLTVDGGAPAGEGPVGPPAVGLRGGTEFCTLRRLRIVDAPGDGVRVVDGRHRHLSVDEVWIDGCGRHGVVVSAPEGRALFLAGLSVDGIGRHPHAGTPVGLLLAAPVQASAVSVERVGPGQVGIAFDPGSDRAAISPWFVRVADGGRAFRGRSQRRDVAVGVGSIERVAGP